MIQNNLNKRLLDFGFVDHYSDKCTHFRLNIFVSQQSRADLAGHSDLPIPVKLLMCVLHPSSLTNVPVFPVLLLLLLLLPGLILLFYLVFYIFLAGMFALTMYVMLQTLDDHKPTWQDRLATPGRLVSTRLTNKPPSRFSTL